jgi:hypothetical protein
MQQYKKLFKYAAPVLFAASFFSAANASPKQQTVQFTATITTKEYLLPAPLCSSGAGGVGTGFASTNLFTKNPSTETTTVALALSDCVTQAADGINDFGPGGFTLSGPGGETIFAKYSGRLTLDPSKYDVTKPNILPFQFGPTPTQFQILGGTGRYTNATGLGTIIGTEIVDTDGKTSVGNLRAVGSITY